MNHNSNVVKKRTIHCFKINIFFVKIFDVIPKLMTVTWLRITIHSITLTNVCGQSFVQTLLTMVNPFVLFPHLCIYSTSLFSAPTIKFISHFIFSEASFRVHSLSLYVTPIVDQTHPLLANSLFYLKDEIWVSEITQKNKSFHHRERINLWHKRSIQTCSDGITNK